MKAIIIGLGTFGASLAAELTQMGHEVIGVDIEIDKVESLKEKVTQTIRMDSTDPQAVTNLPVSDTDIVVVSIGEKEGANILTTALMKQLKPKRLISRSISPLHRTVLEAMGVEEIVQPEEESAHKIAKSLDIIGVIDSFELSGDYNIVQAIPPEKYHGKSLGELSFRVKYNLVVLTTLKKEESRENFGSLNTSGNIQGIATADTIIDKDDVLVLYGHLKDIRAFLENE